MIELIRGKPTNNGTFGRLNLPDGTFIHTLEQNYDDNKNFISSIPCGEYKCEKRISPHFNNVYHLFDVPNRTDILIHAGNWVKDTKGCILVGLSADDTQLYNSRAALKRLHRVLNNKPFTLVIKNGG